MVESPLDAALGGTQVALGGTQVTGYNGGGAGLAITELPVAPYPDITSDPDRGNDRERHAPTPGERPATTPAERHTTPAERTGDLLRRAQAGDEFALEQLFSRYLPRLQRWATGRLPASARQLVDTQDIVQEVLIKAIKHIDGFEQRHGEAFQAYLRKALFNRVKDEIRRKSISRAGLPDDPIDPGPSPVEVAIGRELYERYEAAFDRLKPEDQQAIFLRIELDLSLKEVAEIMQKPSTDAARMAVSRALLRLAEELRDETG
jgi:RNA polymerase sigma-70 factor (ECF subfamily)